MKRKKSSLTLFLFIVAAIVFSTTSVTLAYPENGKAVNHEFTQEGNTRVLTVYCNVDIEFIQWTLNIFGPAKPLLLGGISQTGEFTVRIPGVKTGYTYVFLLGTSDHPAALHSEVYQA